MITQIINFKTKNDLIQKIVVENGLEVSKPSDIADSFNEYFPNIGVNLASKINNISCNYHSPNFQRSFVLRPTTEIEIISTCLSLQNNKSPGHDGITNETLKVTIKYIGKPLTHIFNLCFQNRFVYKQLKIAHIKP
ncbi:unnamed protein product [Psylliodes chrysocephalus]|uniref:Uncharacterized protein n=1 Tax=Psylliodes chrysocephalus TaxID=3402493 RepID=A0A9P0G8T6_9CUCU|nr:unnamed protein product [Psylliodes chrysocephala]